MASCYPQLLLQIMTGVLILKGCYATEEAEAPPSNITVTPSVLKMQTGQSVTLVCSLHKDIKVSTITWFNPNGTDVNQLNDTRILHDGNGTLTIADTRTSDSGEYVCVAGDVWRATADVTIYVMPTYFTEGIIILGINGVLLLVFLICLAHSQIKQRKSIKGQKYREVNKM